jgi:hypothetical protein
MSRSKIPSIQRDEALARNQVLIARGILAPAIFWVNARCKFLSRSERSALPGAITLRDWCGRSYNLMLDVQSPLALCPELLAEGHLFSTRLFRRLELL